MIRTADPVTTAPPPAIHHPRRHAAVRTREYIFNQLIPYIGNKRKLLHLIAQAVTHTRCASGTFVDLFTGSTVVARWAKKQNFAVIANDWEPYAQHMLEVMEASHDFINCAGKGQYSARPAYRPVTKFEQRGRRLGHGAWDLLYRRC